MNRFFPPRLARAARLALIGFVALAGASALRAADDAPAPAASTDTAAPTPKPDLSGNQRVGVASFYANRFAGRQMANGKTMDPQDVNAASRTLPLGTTAKVTNIKTGQSAVVVIEDRGPYAKDRLLDLSPSTAQQIGITPQGGVAKVQVAPITIPLPDGGVKLGSIAKTAKPAKAERSKSVADAKQAARNEQLAARAAHSSVDR